MNDFEEDRQALIELISWYRDDYHKVDFCHSELIRQAEAATSYKDLETIERIVDDWIGS